MARYALVVGIAQYSSNALPPLPKATRDAEKVAQVLEQYGNFKVTRLPYRQNRRTEKLEIVNDPVTAQQLEEALNALLEAQAPDNEVLIYFTGHGLEVTGYGGRKGASGYLATSDCSITKADGKIIREVSGGTSFDRVGRFIKNSQFKNLVVLLDCCHSGYFLERNLIEDTFKFSSRDYCLIAACQRFEEAKAIPSQSHSVFTSALLKGMEASNADKKGEISCDSLWNSINQELKETSQEPLKFSWGASIVLIRYGSQNLPPDTEVPATAALNRTNPYLGLEAFDSSKKNYFFGREAEIRDLVDRLKDNRFLAVIGSSGCGKSSLVKAGLLPQLKSDDIPGSSKWQVESMKPGYRPLKALEEILKRHPDPNQPYLLFIDQFEEAFTLCKDKTEQHNFIRTITDEATLENKQVRVVVTIRADFIEECIKYPEIARLINLDKPTAYYLKNMGLEELEEAIKQPACLHGVEFERGLVRQIVKDVDNQAGALPLLQFALKSLWEVCIEKSTDEQPLLTKVGYEKEISGVTGALNNQADLVYDSLTPSNQNFVWVLFRKLVEVEEGKPPVRQRAVKKELVQLAESYEQFQQVVGRFADQRLIVTDVIVTDESTVEVAHEALLSKWNLLREWIKDNEENLRLERRFNEDSQEWNKKNRPEGLLLTGTWLAAIDEWVNGEQPRLSQLEKEFLRESLGRRDRQIQEKVEQERKLRELAEDNAKTEAENAEKEKQLRELAEDNAKNQSARADAESEKVRVQKQRTRLAIASLIAMTFLTTLAGTAAINAERGQIIALSQASEAKFILNRNSLDPLVEALKAATRLKQIGWVPGNKEVREQVMETLTQAVYWVRERDRLQTHNNIVQSVSFSPDGKMLASAGYDNKVKLWKIEGNQKKSIPLQENFQHNNTVFSVTFSPDSKTIASASFDKTVKLWNQDGTPKGSPLLHSNKVFGVAFNAKGDKIATGDRNGTVTIWDLKENVKTELKNAHKDIVYSLSFSPDGSLLVTGSRDKTAKLWTLDPTQNKRPKVLQHSNVVSSVSFSRNGEVATASKDGLVKLWKADGSFLRQLKGENENEFTSVNFSRDGKIIAAGRLDGKVQLWELNGKEIEILEGHTDRVNSVSFNDDGKTLASASSDQTVKLWQIQLPFLTHLKAHDKRVMDVSFSPDGKIFASASEDKTIKLWKSSGDFQQPLNGHRDLVDSVSFSPNSEKIASTSRDDTVNIWTRQGKGYKQKKPNQIFTRHSSIGDSSVSFSPDLKNQAIAVADPQGIVWFIGENGKQKYPAFQAHQAHILRVRFSPDGKSLATASEDGTAKIWHLDGKLKYTLPGHTSGVEDVSFSRDCNRIATASKDHTVKLWDRNGKLLKTITGHRAAVISVSFSPDGDAIATASGDRTIKLWKLDGTPITTLKGHSRAVNTISFNPTNSKILISGSSDGTIIIWRELENLTLDGLLKRGCEHLHDYLQNNSQELNNICK